MLYGLVLKALCLKAFVFLVDAGLVTWVLPRLVYNIL
jgi:hypothetical protein